MLKYAEILANLLMTEHGLFDWTFEYDNSKRRYGSCRYRIKRITLSKNLTLIREIDNTKNTILHEIAHALVGPKNGHNHIWKAKALEIGCTGDRCSNDVTIKPQFKGICPSGHISYRHRRIKVSCAKCDRYYNEKYLIVWKNNND